MITPQPVTRWRLRRTDSGLQLGEVRTLGNERFTWADLLRVPLSGTRVYALYFPSRFDLPVDSVAADSLRVFGRATSEWTSVDFWDPQDKHFSEALDLFGLRTPPALVLAAGLQRCRPPGLPTFRGRTRSIASASPTRRSSLTGSGWR